MARRRLLARHSERGSRSSAARLSFLPRSSASSLPPAARTKRPARQPESASRPGTTIRSRRVQDGQHAYQRSRVPPDACNSPRPRGRDRRRRGRRGAARTTPTLAAPSSSPRPSPTSSPTSASASTTRAVGPALRSLTRLRWMTSRALQAEAVSRVQLGRRRQRPASERLTGCVRSLGRAEQAAVDRDRRPRDVGGPLRAEERDQVAVLLRRSEPSRPARRASPSRAPPPSSRCMLAIRSVAIFPVATVFIVTPSPATSRASVLK